MAEPGLAAGLPTPLDAEGTSYSGVLYIPAMDCSILFSTVLLLRLGSKVICFPLSLPPPSATCVPTVTARDGLCQHLLPIFYTLKIAKFLAYTNSSWALFIMDEEEIHKHFQVVCTKQCYMVQL